MATNKVQQKHNHHQQQHEEQESSLCDLPLSQNQPSKQNHSLINEKQKEFNFDSWVGLFSTEPKMCVADEVFFKGQILPSRFSYSSEAGLLTTTKSSQFQHDHHHHHHGKQKQFNFKFNQCESNQESSFNIRSNSSSTTSSSSTNSTITTTPIVSVSVSKSKVRNQFHTHPSPKPQLNLKSSCPRKSIQTRKSSLWEIFRLGVVPTPEIGLQDLKVRSNNNNNNKNCVSRNSSSSSSNNSNTKSFKMSKKNEENILKLKQFVVGKRGGLLSGCDCSIESVKLDMKMNKGGNEKTESTKKHAVKEKVMEWKKQKQRQKHGKKVMSRSRTFEWLKELHVNHLDEEALLSNSS